MTPLPTSSRYLVLKYNRHKIIESLTSLKEDPLMSYVLYSICFLYLLFKDFILRLHKMEVYEAINDLRIQFPFRKRKSFTFQLSFITFKNFFNFNCILKNYIQCLRTNIKVITLTEWSNEPMFFVFCFNTMGPAITDYNKRLLILFVIQSSGGHGILNVNSFFESTIYFAYVFFHFLAKQYFFSKHLKILF